MALKKGKFQSDNIINGLVEFKNTGDELLTQAHWDTVILHNYVYTMLYAELSLCEEQTIFEISDNILEQIGKNVIARYGDKYAEFIKKAVSNIGYYDEQLELMTFLNQIEIEESKSEDNKTPQHSEIKARPYIQIHKSAVFEIDAEVVYKNGTTYEKQRVKYQVAAGNHLISHITRIYETTRYGNEPFIAVTT